MIESTASEVSFLYEEAAKALDAILEIGVDDLKGVNPTKADQLLTGLKQGVFVIAVELIFSKKDAYALNYFMVEPNGKRTPLFNFKPHDKPNLMLVH